MKKVWVAAMMDHDRMADGNPPRVLTAEDEVGIEAKVRAYIVESYWNRNMPDEKKDLTDEQVLTMPLEKLAEAFEGECSDEGYSWSIQETEV